MILLHVPPAARPHSVRFVAPLAVLLGYRSARQTALDVRLGALRAAVQLSPDTDKAQRFAA